MLFGGSVRERTQDEEAILLLPDPLQQLGDGRDGHGLGPQRTEAEVQLEATCHLQERRRRHSSYSKCVLQYYYFFLLLRRFGMPPGRRLPFEVFQAHLTGRRLRVKTQEGL